MTDITVLIIAIVGGLAGITVVGIAFWMMRQEDAAKPDTPAAAPVSSVEPQTAPPVDSPVPSTGDAPMGEAVSAPSVAAAALDNNWMSQLRESAPAPIIAEEAPALPSAPATGPIVPEPPRLAPTPAAPTGWLGSLASRVAPTAPPTPAAQELLRLLRTPEGDLVVEVYGKRYHRRSEITEAPVEQQVTNASEDLNRFLVKANDLAVKATPPSALAPIPTSGKKDVPDNRPVVKVSLQEASQMEVKRPSMDIVTQFRYVRSQQSKPVVQIKSVMDEIDEILQVMVIGTSLAPRGLKASDGPHGAVFSLDGKNYDSVDALPDPEARDLLRSAIQKWDQK